MNQVDLEREARELLAAEYRLAGYGYFIKDGQGDSWVGEGEKIAIRAIVAALRKPQQEAKNAEPNDDGGIEFVRKHGLFIYEVDFGDEGKGRYVRLRDFNRVAALVPQQEAPGVVKPWGYLHTLPDGRWKVSKDSPHGAGFSSWVAETIPLYTSPTIGQQAVDDAMVERAFNAWCDVADVDEYRVRNSHEALRAALTAALAADGGKSD